MGCERKPRSEMEQDDSRMETNKVKEVVGYWGLQ